MRRLVSLAGVLLLGVPLLSPLLLSVPAGADDLVKWTSVNTPTDGKAGNWVLANGSDVQHLRMAANGDLYAYGKGLTYTLYKSTDGGISWKYTGNVKDVIMDIATAADSAAVIYYATTSAVYKSKDGGATFESLLPNPGGAGSGHVEITSIDVTRMDTGYVLAVATRDTDALEYGGVSFLDESQAVPRWQNTMVGNYDAYLVRFSPGYATDRSLIAVITDETDTLVTFKSSNNGWSANIGNAKLSKDNALVSSAIAVANSASISFPDSWNAAEPSSFFVAIDSGSGNGDVYKITPRQASISTATDLNIASINGLSNLDVTSVAASGSGAQLRLLAGAAASTHIYSSNDAGKTWTKNIKEPTGTSKTYVALAADFAKSNMAYAVTSGEESAFSCSTTGGSIWNQTSLIDSTVSSIKDVAISPDYEHDSTIFLLTLGGKTGLWRSRNGGVSWERIFTNALPYVDQMTLVRLSPQYSASKTVFIAGTKGANSIVGKSMDGGQTFRIQLAVDPTSMAAIVTDVLTAADDNTLFIGSFSGSNAVVYQSKDGGFIYSPAVEAGASPLVSVVLSPRYAQDKTILVSNNSGGVFISRNSGASFDSVPLSATLPLTGLITTAFDADYAANRTIYAVSNTADKGIYRFVIGSSTKWETIDSTFAAGGKFNPVQVSADGILYAVNTKANAGMERSLNPSYALGPAFETVTRGLDTGVTLNGLWLSGNQLWSVDVTNTRLMTFIDTLTKTVALTAPTNKATGLGRTNSGAVKSVTLDWQTVPGATGYTWQLNNTTNFASVPSEFTGDTAATSTGNLPALEPGTTYYWRVRASSPVLSPWSEKWSFTTTLGSGSSAPKLSFPEGSASGISVTPIFQWNVLDGATDYELLVSTDSSFSPSAIDRTGKNMLNATAWKSDVKLNYATTYFWKVRAVGDKTTSGWSSVSAFTTESVPIASPSPVVTTLPVPPAPSPSQAPATITTVQTTSFFPGWMMYLFAAVLIAVVLVAVTVVVMLVMKMRRGS